MQLVNARISLKKTFYLQSEVESQQIIDRDT